MKKLIVILFVIIASSMQAQYVRPSDTSNASLRHPALQQSNKFADKLSMGGSFSLQFGDVTFVEMEPLLSYHITQNFMVGIGPVYQYQNVDAQVYGYGYTSSIYGGRIAALYFLPDEFSKVFIMGEYDLLNVPELSFYSYQVDRGYLSLPMLGLGYKDPISAKAFVCLYVLWNFNNSPYSPFTNPIINFGLDFGLWR